MMAGNDDGPDASSIKPVSSLRSRFENLGKSQEPTPALSPSARQPSSNGIKSSDGQRPSTSGGQSSHSGLDAFSQHTTPVRDRLGSGENVTNMDSGLLPALRRKRPDVPPSRPVSMISVLPSQPSPPLLTVESPRSPHKTMSVDLRSSNGATPLRSLTPTLGSDSPTKGHSRTISRATTPGLEARMHAFLQAAETPKSDVHGRVLTQTKSSETLAKKAVVSVPPLVNRAAKPQIPAKPTTMLSKKASGLSAPENNPELTDQSVSPFSTPPSSGNSSPGQRRNPSPKRKEGLQRPRTESDAPSLQRERASSNASWVQRLRGDSEASFVECARTDSNASFVESSHLPDSWLPPPVHHAVAARRDHQAENGTFTPSRNFATSEWTAAEMSDIPEDRPRLPSRPELLMRSGRTSPTKLRSGRYSPTKLSSSLPTARISVADSTGTQHATSAHGTPKSALSQGFDRASPIGRQTGPPSVPAPRRSVDRRRDLPPPALTAVSRTPIDGHLPDDEEDPSSIYLNSEPQMSTTDFPDATQANRRPPKFKQRPWQIPTDYDTRLFAVCGEHVCTTGYLTKVWNMRSGEQLLYIEHRENTKVLSIVFKPMPEMNDEGKRFWLGTSIGEIHEIDVPSQGLVKTRANAHSRREIIRMFRYGREIWSLDDGGELNVWKADRSKVLDLESQYTKWRVARGHTYSIACGKQLWLATGKDIRVYLPSAATDMEFQLTKSSLSQPGAGDVTAGAVFNGKENLVYFGHSDGKVSVYNRESLSCVGIVNVSLYKISSLAGVGDNLWAGYSTGMAYVYDTSTSPWTVKKDWQAHDKQICSIIADSSAFWTMGRLNVVTLGLDNLLRIWDGMLEDDWLQTRMHERDSEFCSFREMTAAVMTWNAGASKPAYLQHNREDNNFFQDYLNAQDLPDILVFGFQELVDLEDKKVTAKSFFKSKKKDGNDQDHMSHQYRAWRDHLTKCIDGIIPASRSYTLLHTASLVGLFTCIFVKSIEKARIKHVQSSEIKRGMGGRYGNKGALVVRMILDDSSICFVNCHLAAGQTQTMHRNNDVAAILEANTLPPYPLNDTDGAQHSDVFVAGGDGSLILDHEICVLNGDLNYRIDTMGRDIVVKHVHQGNLAKLLERDQLLLSRKKNPGFRLRAFQESPINFAPTYKYNVRTDEYDTSEKRRAPAWCDRILYRGIGKVKMEEYRRWDQIRVSDHRPVSGRLRLRVKSVNTEKRDRIWQKCSTEFESVKARITQAAQLEFLTNVLGLPYNESLAAVSKR